MLRVHGGQDGRRHPDLDAAKTAERFQRGPHRAGYSRWLALLILVPIVNIVALLIWAFDILPRAGYSRWLALVLLISPVNIVALWMFAYAKWTVSGRSEDRDRNRQLDNWSEAENETFRNLMNRPPA